MVSPFDPNVNTTELTDTPGVLDTRLYPVRLNIIAASAVVPLSTGIHAAIADTGGVNVVTTGITNPAVPRNVTATPGGTTANVTAVAVIIAGTDYAGNAITETLPVFTAGAATAVAGNKAFKTIISITLPANGASVTTAIGYGAKLGLPDLLVLNTFVAAYLATVREATMPTVAFDAANLSGNTVTLNSTLNGTAVDLVYLV